MRRRPETIVIVSRVYAPQPAAAAFRLEAVAREWIAAGYHVVVLTGANSRAPAGRRRGAHGERILSIPMVAGSGDGLRRLASTMSFDIPLAFRLLPLVLRHRPRLILSEPPPTTGLIVAVLSHLVRIPSVYFAADLWSLMFTGTSLPRRIMRRLFGRVEGSCLSLNSRVVTVNQSLREVIKDEFSVSAAVVGNGVDLDVYRPSEARRTMSLVYAGTLGVAQDAAVLVHIGEICAAVDSAITVDVYGDGVDREGIEQLARSKNVTNVKFHGLVSSSMVAEAYSRARCAVVLLKEEPALAAAMPTKLFTAAGCGLPTLYIGPEGLASAAINLHGLGQSTTRATAEAQAKPWLCSLFSGTIVYDSAKLRRWAEDHGSLRAVAKRVLRECQEIG